MARSSRGTTATSRGTSATGSWSTRPPWPTRTTPACRSCRPRDRRGGRGAQRASAPRTRPQLELRIGIHTGSSSASSVPASGCCSRSSATPRTSRPACRAADDTVVVSPTTARLIEGYFSCPVARSAGAQGTSRAARDLRSARPRRRGPSAGRLVVTSQPARRTGRRDGRPRRSGRARTARARSCCCASGIGKSRQAQALREWLARENVASLELRCSAYHQDSAAIPSSTSSSAP